MDNVQVLFSTPIFQSKLDVPEFITDHLRNQKVEKVFGGYKSEENILDHPLLERPKTFLMRKVNTFFHNVCGYSDSVKLEIVCSWINLHKPGNWAHSHSHLNSIVSGVWYISTTEKTGSISFLRDNLLFGSSISFDVNDINSHNQQDYSFNPRSGDVLIFPSNLIHSVNPNLDECDRISIAFNCIARGTVKTEGTSYTI
jgi:uncharacterized protein (TIGR02466 family)